jgi:D-sedoheptulose 7-phosphate isomerase
MSLTSTITSGLKASADVMNRLADSSEVVSTLEAVALACLQAYRAGNKILLAGNGGSAADCQHIAGELVARFNFDRPGLAAIALTVDSSVLTAIGNDYGYERVFARQVEALGANGDILFAYSTSGSSANIVAAIQAARAKGMRVVGLTGMRDSPMARGLCDHLLRTPATHTPWIQEGHLVMGHMICQLIEDGLFGGSRPAAAPGPAAP